MRTANFLNIRHVYVYVENNWVSTKFTPTKDQVLLDLVAWPLYMFCYCSDFKYLKWSKINAYLGIIKRGAGVKESECEHVCEWLKDKQDTEHSELSKGSR